MEVGPRCCRGHILPGPGLVSRASAGGCALVRRARHGKAPPPQATPRRPAAAAARLPKAACLAHRVGADSLGESDPGQAGGAVSETLATARVAGGQAAGRRVRSRAGARRGRLGGVCDERLAPERGAEQGGYEGAQGCPDPARGAGGKAEGRESCRPRRPGGGGEAEDRPGRARGEPRGERRQGVRAGRVGPGQRPADLRDGGHPCEPGGGLAGHDGLREPSGRDPQPEGVRRPGVLP
mmetsp:Transcript_14362/g.36687  ORF Transcript_14362/g.36687 Transcript_14362/m.36687 type:complete len:238 (-) Transcript_14362:852-1565(-)